MTTAPRGRMRTIQREQTRVRIIDAAIEVFAARGYARSTVDEIAERAGTTRTTFYLHFNTKAQILPELVARNSGQFDDLYQDLANIFIEPDIDRIRRWIESVMGKWVDVADTARPLLEAAMIEPEFRGQMDHPERPHVDMLADALTQSSHISDRNEAFVFATVLLAPLNHFFQLLVGGTDFDRDGVVDVLARTWVAVMSTATRESTDRRRTPR